MIFAFTVSWAAFVYPMAFLYSSDQQVLTVGTVTSLIRGDVYKWGMLMAGALLAAAPPLVIYAFLMDYYIAGLTAGSDQKAKFGGERGDRGNGHGGSCIA